MRPAGILKAPVRCLRMIKACDILQKAGFDRRKIQWVPTRAE